MKITAKTLHTFGLLFAIIGNAQATEITNANATGTTFKFSATLNVPLTAGNKVKIDFGKGGLKAMTCSAKTCTLSSNALPTGISTATYKIGIYDAKNVLQGSTSDGTYVISSSSNATASTTDSITTDYNKITGYTKIANDGSELPDSAKLGANPKDWACTQDNKTGRMWEMKTTDGGLHDSTKTYTNYTPDYDPNNLYNAQTNANGFVTEVNLQSLCGKKNWRLPTNAELKGLVVCYDGKYETLAEGDVGGICTNYSSVTRPTINATYFPNTISSVFWSSSPLALNSNGAWSVNFSYGSSYYYFKFNDNNVRLVRG